MSEFLNGLRRERDERESAAAELAIERQDADGQLSAARAALTRWREANSERIERRGYLEAEASEETRLENEVDVASDRVDQLERGQKHARDRIREIDGYIHAEKALADARAAWADGGRSLRELRGKAAKLGEIVRSLGEEIEALETKRKRALDEHGDAAVTARLAGKVAPTPKAVLATHEADLASRRAELASAERASAETQTAIDALLEASTQDRANLREAMRRRAELAYYEALPSFLPVVARLIALASWIGGAPNIGNLFSIRCDPELVRAAADEIDNELRGEAA